MKILKENPPNIEKIQKVFDLKNKKPIFAYGDTIYNPHGISIDKALLVHEETHCKQQGEKVEEWWDRYLTDVEFRISQEVEAYQNHLAEAKKWIKDRNKQMQFAYMLAEELSGTLYGNIVDKKTALDLILK